MQGMLLNILINNFKWFFDDTFTTVKIFVFRKFQSLLQYHYSTALYPDPVESLKELASDTISIGLKGMVHIWVRYSTILSSTF